jgi:hypothetical protein
MHVHRGSPGLRAVPRVPAELGGAARQFGVSIAPAAAVDAGLNLHPHTLDRGTVGCRESQLTLNQWRRLRGCYQQMKLDNCSDSLVNSTAFPHETFGNVIDSSPGTTGHPLEEIS